MNYPLISDYIEAIKSAEDNFEELKHLRPVLDEDGEPVMTGGNFAVVFKMKDEQTGKLHAVKCFLKEQEGRAEAYRMIAEELEYVSSTFLTPIKYLDKELFVDSKNSDESEFPVLLMDWVEGQTLDRYIQKYVYRYQRAENLDETTESEEKAVELLVNGYELENIAYQFSCLAIWLLQQPFAHGDLKPDNIIVKEDGTLVLVDYDGMYVPAMKGQKARELGSPDFRHPLRNENDFDEHIDDFPLSSILLSLLAIANEPSLLEKYGGDGRLLLSVRDYRNIAESEVLGALRPLMADKNLTTYLSLFYLCSAQKSLFKESYHLFVLPEPEKPYFMVEVKNLNTELTEEDLANAWIDEYGVKYSADRKRLLKAPENLRNYSVIDGTKVICDKAFLNCDYWGDPTSDLQSIVIPNSVKAIGDYCFWNCRELSSIKLYYGIETIGTGAFRDCTSIEVIQLPKSLRKLGDSAFRDCINLHYVGFNCLLTSVPYGVFSGCLSLISIVLPNSIEVIENYAFYDCENLGFISFPPKTKEIGDFAFKGCESLTSIIIPEGVTYIGGSAFSGCSSLIQVSLPSSINEFGRMYENGIGAQETLSATSFDNCELLESIYISKGDEFVKNALSRYNDKLIEREADWKSIYPTPATLKMKLIEKKIQFLSQSLGFLIGSYYIEDLKSELINWELEEVVHFWEEEKIEFLFGDFDSVTTAVVVDSDYGYSVRFLTNEGGEIYVPLIETSALCLRDTLDMNSAKVLIIFHKDKNNICKIVN